MISPMNAFCQFYHYCSLRNSQLGKGMSMFCSLAAWMASSGTMKTTQQGEASRSSPALFLQVLLPKYVVSSCFFSMQYLHKQGLAIKFWQSSKSSDSSLHYFEATGTPFTNTYERGILFLALRLLPPMASGRSIILSLNYLLS